MSGDALNGCMQWTYEQDYKRSQGRTERNVKVHEQGSLLGSTSTSTMDYPMRQRPGLSHKTSNKCYRLVYALALTAIPCAMAERCVSLASSTQCPAFNESSISTDSTLSGLFPFLANVTDTTSFDTQLQQYISTAFPQERYENLIGCSSYNPSNTTNYYARYTTSVLCNAIVQNSIDPCGLNSTAARPLCAETCAEYAESEETISASDYCGTTSSNSISQIRADFTNCALPADSLSGSCVEGATNQPDNCGFSSNLGSLCSYCAASSPNATDSCCVYSDTETRCAGVVLPIVATSTMPTLFTSSTSSPSSLATSSAAATVGHSRGLSGGAIAGIVVGAVLGAFLLLALLVLGCILFRRHQQKSPESSVFNRPAQARQPQMALRNDGARSQRDNLDVVPGGRVTRMSAIEGISSHSDIENPVIVPAAYPKSSSEEESPRSFALVPPPRKQRSGSLSSSVALSGAENTSPRDAVSSPDTTESEQLDFFKDYYSQDEIHPQDLVSALWAYQPRAGDEFQLERGDMLKVLGIWDDGWATGVRVHMQAEDWRAEDKLQRDSGMSSSRANTPEEHGEVKAFPLVCVCLPQHWRKTIEGDSTQGTGATADEP